MLGRVRRRDKWRTGLGTVLAFGLIVTACGGADSEAATTSSSIPTPTTTTTSTSTSTTTIPPTTTTTSTSTSTTTIPPTTTTTLPPPPVAAWDGEGVYEVALEFDFEPRSWSSHFERTVRGATEARLESVGITVSDHAKTVLLFDVVGQALSATYETVGRCYSGATVSGTVTLIDPQHPPVDVAVSFTIPPARVISTCWEEPGFMPEYLDAFDQVRTAAITDLWQEAAFPMLMDCMAEDYVWGLLYRQVAAMDAFEGIDDEAIGPTDTVMFLGAVIDLVEYLVETEGKSGVTDRHDRAEAAASRLLEAYAGVNYGVSTMEDVEEWREWLAAWDPHWA